MSRMTKILLILSVVVFAFSLSSFAQQPDDEMVRCAVSGEKIKKSDAKGTYEYNGETYYFCCDNCIESFKSDPEKFIHQKDQDAQLHSHHDSEGHMHEQGDDTVVDPVCGMKIKKSEAKATHEYKGKTYYFCMEGCKEKFVENPENYVKENGDKVTCPVMGREIAKSEAASSLEYKGKTYYFCCAGCKEKFEKDPEKYAKK